MSDETTEKAVAIKSQSLVEKTFKSESIEVKAIDHENEESKDGRKESPKSSES